jgi:hypothetical protein
MNVRISVIPHKAQPYPTCGYWGYDTDGTLVITVSGMDNWKYEMLVAAHELVEALLCKRDRVSCKSVDKFDIAYEKRRPSLCTDEPGDEPSAPYCRQHCLATGVERIMAALLWVSWKKYEAKINSL